MTSEEMGKVRSIMPIHFAVKQYGTSDKEKFECSYPEAQMNRPNATFYADFSVADYYGPKAIQDTYHKALLWKDNAKMWTECVMALNHKLWFWHNYGITEYSELYDKLWKEADAYACENFKGDDATHYFSVTD